MTAENRGITEFECELLGHKISVQTGAGGSKVPIGELENPRHYTGPDKFSLIVYFGGMVEGIGLRNSIVPEESRWSHKNPPPDGIRILGFDDREVEKQLEEISNLANNNSPTDKDAADKYYKLTENIYKKMPEATGVDLKETVFLGLLRAGGVAGEMLGIPYGDQVLINTKRLQKAGNGGGHMSIGIDYLTTNGLPPNSLNGREWLVADPAGATFSSIIANMVFLRNLGIRPSKLIVWNVVASHMGSLFAQKAMEELGIDFELVAGGYSPVMNENYYLVRPDGKQSVGDAGDRLCASSHVDLSCINFS
jgi:uracil phosphoribosyltransferase